MGAIFLFVCGVFVGFSLGVLAMSLAAMTRGDVDDM